MVNLGNNDDNKINNNYYNNNNVSENAYKCQRMCNKRVQVIPVIIDAKGVIDKNIKKYIGKIPVHYNIYKRAVISNTRNSTYPEKGTVNKARVSNRAHFQTMPSPGCRDYHKWNIVEAIN